MREIAKDAGVSLATVSYALRGSGKISEQTRERILTIAEKMGYQADPSFAVLGARRWEHKSSYNGLSIAYIAQKRNQWTRFQQLCFQGCDDQARKLGYHINHICPDDFENPKHMGEVLEARSYNGIILRRLNTVDAIKEFPFHKFSVVACGRGNIDPLCHIVMPHHHYNLHQCWQHLRQQGHNRIGCILLDNDPLAELPEFYIGAYLQEQLALPKKDRIPHYLCTEHVQKNLRAWIERWQPDAIIACVDYIHNWLDTHGRAFKQKPAFSCLEKIDLKNKLIDGVDLRPHLMGATTVDQLDRAIRANERGLPAVRQTIHIESTWSGQ